MSGHSVFISLVRQMLPQSPYPRVCCVAQVLSSQTDLHCAFTDISPQHRLDTIGLIIHTYSSYAVAQPHKDSEHRLVLRPKIIHSGSGAKCLCDYIVGKGHCRADTGGTSANSNVDIAYHDAGDAATIRISSSSDSRIGEDRFDPDTRHDTPRTCRRNGGYEGDRTACHVERSADQDFGEWSHKVRTFMLARFGDDILTALTWASRHRKSLSKVCGPSKRNRMIPWIDVFGEGADEEDQIDEIDGFVVKLYAYLVSFTTDAANRIVRNSGEGNGLEA